MHRYFLALLCLLTLLFFSQAHAEAPGLGLITLQTGGHSEKLILDLKGGLSCRVLHQKKPDRLLIRLPGLTKSRSLRQPRNGESVVGRLHFESAAEGMGQNLVVDLLKPVVPKASLRRQGSTVQLVLELASVRPSVKEAPQKVHSKESHVAITSNLGKESSNAGKTRMIAIDAGHGGKDTGAIGPHGTLEKQVVLSIARRLKSLIDAESGFRAYLVRKGDYFIPLRDRVELAQEAHADLFISLHADAHLTNDVRGSSVFTLSRNGATSEAARLLANRENAADLIGGRHLRDSEDHMLASVLLDLSQGATLESSDRIAGRVLKELQKHGQVRHAEVQKAGFAVLKSPNMPSLLIETAFISNPEEERHLADPGHQEALAKAIFAGIRSFFARSEASGSMSQKRSSDHGAKPQRHLALLQDVYE